MSTLCSRIVRYVSAIHKAPYIVVYYTPAVSHVIENIHFYEVYIFLLNGVAWIIDLQSWLCGQWSTRECSVGGKIRQLILVVVIDCCGSDVECERYLDLKIRVYLYPLLDSGMEIRG